MKVRAELNKIKKPKLRNKQSEKSSLKMLTKLVKPQKDRKGKTHTHTHRPQEMGQGKAANDQYQN